jgi:hypothetical protein
MHTDPERDLPGLQELPLLRLVHGLAPKQVQRLRVRTGLTFRSELDLRRVESRSGKSGNVAQGDAFLLGVH